MILNCPSCSAKFMISSEALGEAGREVRCGKCGHMWFQASERDSLDELAAEEPISRFERAQLPKEGGDDIGFQTHVDVPEPETPIFEKRHQNIEIDFKDTPIAKLPATRQQQAASVMVALAIVSVLFFGFVAMRAPIAKSIPFLAGAYTQMGFPLEKEEPKIAFDRLRLTREKNNVSGSGYIINLTSDDVAVKGIKLELTDLDYKVLKTTEIHIPDNELKSESSSKIDFSFADAPHGAVSVRATIIQ